MSLSKPIGLRQSRPAVTAPSSAKTKGQSRHVVSRKRLTRHSNCKAQTSSGTHPREGWAYSNKMIKEDHLLACTTKMFEILSCIDCVKSISSGISPEHVPVQAKSQATHPRGFRLFTCQRALHKSISSASRNGEAEYYRRFQHCQRYLARIFYILTKHQSQANNQSGPELYDRHQPIVQPARRKNKLSQTSPSGHIDSKFSSVA